MDDARSLLADLDAAVLRARSAATEEMQHLRVGGIDAALIWFLPPVIRAFRLKHPGIHLPLTEVSSSAQQVQELLRHRIDIAFFRPPIKDEGITWETLFEEKVFAALPEGSPLLDRPSLRAADLVDTNLIGYPRSGRPYLAAAIYDSFAAEGLRPRIDLEVLDKSTLLQLVAQGSGVGLVPQWVTETPVPGVAFREYTSALGPMQFGVGWRTQDQGASLTAFLDLVRAEARKVRTRFDKAQGCSQHRRFPRRTR